MALRVSTSRPRGRIVGVGYNYGMQGGRSPNLQPATGGRRLQNTVPGRILQPAAPRRPLQPAAPRRSVQPAATAQQVAAAAARRRAQARAEAERKKRVIRQKLTVKASGIASGIRLQVSTRPDSRRISGVSTARPSARIVQPARTKYDDVRAQAYRDAMQRFRSRMAGGDKSGLSGVFDKLTFGSDRRGIAAREWAQKELQRLTNRSVSDYEKRLNSFLSGQARRRQRIEQAKFSSRGAFDRAVSEYQAWERASVDDLERRRASLTGMAKAYEDAAGMPLQSTAARGISAVHRATQPLHSAMSTLWRHTLGQGSQNVPSLVTAPSRALNFLGNINTPDRRIYQHGGGAVNRQTAGLNAWQATFNQRNFNIRPVRDQPYDKQTAWRELQTRQVSGSVQDLRFLREFQKAKTDKQRDQVARKYWENRNIAARSANTLQELAADPLNLAGGAGFLRRAVGRPARAFTRALQGTRPARSFTSALKTATASKPIKWLTSEAKSPAAKLSDAIDIAKAAQGTAQKKLLPRVNQLNRKLVENPNLDVSVFDDLARLGDHEAKILQRMVDGKLSARDRLRLVGPGNRPVRELLEDLARRWTDFTEQMKLADRVERTRFGRGKRLYSPRTSFLEDLNQLDFRRRSRGRIQSAGDFYRGAVDRYFRSNLDQSFAAGQTSRRARMQSERDALLRQYDETVEPARAGVLEAQRKTRTPYGRARGLLDRFGPTSVWKKSVLKYRPAWYVNNFLYNTQAAALAGGPRALLEQTRMLRPRNFRRAMSEVPDEVRTKLANEVGTGRISRFASGVENLSRVAAFRGAKAKGLSDEQALKRVNKYLFDYTVKNWERPLRAVVPFWSWQKNLAKAATQLPFDRPGAAIAYNRIDRAQRQQFDQQFDQLVPQLKEMGYSDAEIQDMREQQRKYFGGRLKVGNQYITTPWHAFAEKGLSGVGINPWLSALGETATATDQYGRPISGADASLGSRFLGKFPQAGIAQGGLNKFLIASGRRRPSSEWIGEPGSGGYGLTKEAQGFDPSAPNYQKGLDRGAKFWQDVLAYAGVPRGLEFDESTFLQRKKMQRLKTEYFTVDWDSLDYEAAERRRNKLFKKYGVSSDQFYKGELARYDSPNTKRVKNMREEARQKTARLFEEYQRQPKGTRNVWATQKLRELVDGGYFAQNPFLRSFDWTNPDTIAKAHRKIDYDTAKASGNWSKFYSKYGVSSKRQKYLDYQVAKDSGDWTSYNKKYGVSPKAARAQFWARYYSEANEAKRRQMLVENPQYSKFTPKSQEEIAEGKFWARYSAADRESRRQLLAANPQYNRRATWTDEMWDRWKRERKATVRRETPGFEQRLRENLLRNRRAAYPVQAKRRRAAKVVFNLT